MKRPSPKKVVLKRKRRNEKGVALVIVSLVLLLLTVLIISANYMTLSQVNSTSNYRLSTQGFYVAEAGVQRSIQWFSYYYTPQNWPTLNTAIYPAQVNSTSD